MLLLRFIQQNERFNLKMFKIYTLLQDNHTKYHKPYNDVFGLSTLNDFNLIRNKDANIRF
jgi:hypothetical protein